MKIIKSVVRTKYKNREKYKPVGKNIFQDLENNHVYLTLYCELEEEENTEEPLENLLDEYYVNCTDYLEETEVDGKKVIIFELEGSLADTGGVSDDMKNMKAVAALVGGRVYEDDWGNYIEEVAEQKVPKKGSRNYLTYGACYGLLAGSVGMSMCSMYGRTDLGAVALCGGVVLGLFIGMSLKKK